MGIRGAKLNTSRTGEDDLRLRNWLAVRGFSADQVVIHRSTSKLIFWRANKPVTADFRQRGLVGVSNISVTRDGRLFTPADLDREFEALGVTPDN